VTRSKGGGGQVVKLQVAANLPQSQMSERGVLGTCMLDLDGETVRLLSDGWLKPDCFYSDRHQRLWRLMVKRARAFLPVGMVDVIEEITNGTHDPEAFGGLAYVSGLSDECPSLEAITHYAGEVRALAERRALIFEARTLEDLARDRGVALDEMYVKAGELLGKIRDRAVAMSDGWETYQDALITHTDVLATRIEAHQAGTPIGMASPWLALDGRIGPLQRGNVTVIAGRPGMGKTAIALELAGHLARTAGPVALISLEMPTGQLLDRQIATESGIWQSKIRDGSMSPFDFMQIQAAMGRLAELPILVSDDTTLTASRLAQHIQRAQAKAMRLYDRPLAGVVLDYMQLLKSDGRSREEEVSATARALKIEVARGLNVHVIALAQLNRKAEERRDKRPQVSDLRESGAIEQDADSILLLFRREVYRGQGVFSDEELSEPGLMEMIAGKARHGSCGSVWLRWDLDRNRITEEANQDAGWPS